MFGELDCASVVFGLILNLLLLSAVFFKSFQQSQYIQPSELYSMNSFYMARLHDGVMEPKTFQFQKNTVLVSHYILGGHQTPILNSPSEPTRTY